MASGSSKLTKYKSAVTIVTADTANSWFGGLYGSGEAAGLDADDPRVIGHIHDGQHIDGHAGKVDLVDHVDNQLRNVNLADDAVTARNVRGFTSQSSAIPEYEVIGSSTYYYLDLSIVRSDLAGGGGGGSTFRSELVGVTGSGTLSPSEIITNADSGSFSQIVYYKANIVAHAWAAVPPAVDDTACWTVEGCVVRDQSTDTISLPVAPVITPLYNPNPNDWDVNVTVDNVSKELDILVSVNGFGAGPANAPDASFYAEITFTAAAMPL